MMLHLALMTVAVLGCLWAALQALDVWLIRRDTRKRHEASREALQEDFWRRYDAAKRESWDHR